MELFMFDQILWGIGMALLGSIVFSAIGLISGTDETATVAPLTLLVVLIGVPPVGIFSWFMAAVIGKHMTHAIPTALLGIPGDTMAVPMLADATTLRHLGVPHIALRKMISGGIISAFVALPISILFATVLAPFADLVKTWAPVIFTVAAVIIAYTSGGRWGSILALIPFAIFIQGLSHLGLDFGHKGLFICFFLGIAIGPLFADLLTVLAPPSRHILERQGPREFWLAPEMKMWNGYFPNPFHVLTRAQKGFTAVCAAISSLTFTFSPVGMTVMAGEAVGSRVKGLYRRCTTKLSVMNGVTEATYIAEALIPLIAFGIPLSPVGLGPAAPLFNAPPVFTAAAGEMHNLHTLMTPLQFFVFGLIGIFFAALIAYPFSMNYARRASAWVLRKVSQEAIISMFTGLIVVLSYSEGGFAGVGIAITVAIFGGVLNRYFGIHTGVQFMTYYASSWIVAQIFPY